MVDTGAFMGVGLGDLICQALFSIDLLVSTEFCEAVGDEAAGHCGTEVGSGVVLGKGGVIDAAFELAARQGYKGK